MMRLAGIRTSLETVTPERNYMMVDWFGYQTGHPKVVVISDPQTGSNNADQFVPSAKLELRKVADESVVFEASPSS
jgi:hypothetical protein